MSDVNELEDRFRAALSRIEDAAARIPDQQSRNEAEAELGSLRKQVDEERKANADLVGRVNGLQERQDNEVARLEEALAASQTSEAEKSAIQQELKARVEELRDQVARLTEANRAMVGDPALVNTAMMAELEAMRSSRRADVSEVDDILAQLNPHFEGEAHA